MSAGALCHLEAALGRAGPCADQVCAFWDDDGCAVAAVRIDAEVNAMFAAALLELRATLEAGRLLVEPVPQAGSSPSRPSASA